MAAEGGITSRAYPERDLVGYGEFPPDPCWPNGARLCLSLCLNYEEGGEYSVQEGDAHSEAYLTEIAGRQPVQGGRDTSAESDFEYGSRAGFWRLLRLFEEFNLHFTAWAVGRALERNPEAGRRMAECGHEVAGHGQRWITYGDMPEEEELEHIDRMFKAIESTSGVPPSGYYIGRHTPRTLALLAQYHAKVGSELLYESDIYNDDLPYWIPAPGRPASEGLLMIPYSLANNDFRFGIANGFSSPNDLFEQLKAEFDCLYREGGRMMSVGLHCRFAGKAGRSEAVRRFFEYIKGFPGVWVATRREIALHWRKVHPYTPSVDP